MASLELLTPRWTPLRPHPIQLELASFAGRFAVVPAGRRSGKTERAKRHVIRRALRHRLPWPGRYFLAAPTRDQAKSIFWEDLKAFVPTWALRDRPLETELRVYLINGSMIQVIGMDKPERIEGSPWDGGVLDEYANMKPESWTHHVRPALSDRQGWCWLTGVPEGRNHYYDLWKQALSDPTGTWAGFTWHSSDILDREEVEQARKDLDELVFKQEYEGSFVNFEGMAYYAWDERLHTSKELTYNPRAPLSFCFDFNVDPGVAAIIQEQPHPRLTTRSVTGVISEVYIPRNSTTELVCNRLIKDWGHHEGNVVCYGDATGGARGTAKVAGSDWDIIKSKLRPVFGDRLYFEVPKANPAERVRINAVNTRLKSAAGTVHMLVDPLHAPHVVKDFEGVRTVKGGSGEIDKRADPKLTHISDAVGYYIVHKYPIHSRKTTSKEYLL